MTKEETEDLSRRSVPTRTMLDDLIVFAILGAPSVFFFLRDDMTSLTLWLFAGVMALVGYRIGLLMHLAVILSLLVLADVGESIAKMIQEPITQVTGLTGLANRMVGCALAVIVVVTSITLISRWLSRGFLQQGNRHRWNHWLGWLAGSIEGFLILALLIGVFSTIAQYQRENQVQSWVGEVTGGGRKAKFLKWVEGKGTQFEESRVGKVFVGPRPLVTVREWGIVKKTGTVFEFFAKPSSIKSLQKFPAYQELTSDGAVNAWLKTLKDDKPVKEMFRSNLPLTGKQIGILLNHPSIMGLLDETVFRQKVSDLFDELDASKIDPPGPKTMF
jgi:hypothetical protein